MIPHSDAVENLRRTVHLNAAEKQAIRRRQSEGGLSFDEQRSLRARLREIDAEDLIVWDELRMRECKARAEAA